MNLQRIFCVHHTQPPPFIAFSYFHARRCLTCHLVWDGGISSQCPSGHAASVTLCALTQEKNEQILKLQQMVRKLLRMVGMKDEIIRAASQRPRGPLVQPHDLLPSA